MPDQQDTAQADDPTRVEIVVSLDRRIGTRYDDDGEPVDDITVLDRVIECAASELVRRERYDLQTLIRDAISERARAAADEAIAAALSGPLQPTSRFGEPKGERTTLRELIVEEVGRWLNRPKGDYGRESPAFVTLLTNEVDAAMKKELVDEVRKARDIAVARVKDQAANLVAGAVREAMKP